MFASPERNGFSQMTVPPRMILLVPSTMIGERSDQDFRAKCRLPELGMGEPQIIVALNDVVTELVRKANAEAVGDPIWTNQVNARQLRLLAAVQGEVGNGKRFARADELRPIAFVKPFRLTSDIARRRLSALDTLEEHAH